MSPSARKYCGFQTSFFWAGAASLCTPTRFAVLTYRLALGHVWYLHTGWAICGTDLHSMCGTDMHAVQCVVLTYVPRDMRYAMTSLLRAVLRCAVLRHARRDQTAAAVLRLGMVLQAARAGDAHQVH
eukprot:529909-Rhodomonas_salina.1